MRTLALLLAFALAPSSLADWYTVDANDPGADFQDLQVAIDTVLDGSVLLVRGRHGSYAGYTIDARTLILAGDNSSARLESYSGDNNQPTLSILNGADVALSHLEVEGTWSDEAYVTTPAIFCDASHLLVDQSDLLGGTGTYYDLTDNGSPACRIRGSLCRFTSCLIQGGDGGPSDWATHYPGWSGSGGDGLEIHGESEVVLKDCTVRGGDGGNLEFHYEYDGMGDITIGDGGDAVSGSPCYYAHSTFRGGAAGQAIWDNGNPYDGNDDGFDYGTDGVPGNDPALELPDTLSLWEWSFFIGSDAVIEGTGTPRGLHWLFFSFETIPAIQTRSGPFFLGAPLRTFPVRASSGGSWLLDAPIPFDYDLVGVRMYFQALDLPAGSLSCLEAGVIGS